MITSYKRKRVDDIDDDDDDDDFLRDGERRRVSIDMLDSDSVQRSIALSKYVKAGRGHRPGFVTDDDSDARDAAETARDEYVQWLGEACRQRRSDAASHASTTDAAPAAASLSKEEAYRQYCEYLSNAWRSRR